MSHWSKYVFMAVNLITALVFLLGAFGVGPLPIKDGVGQIAAGETPSGLAWEVGNIYGEVIFALSLMLALTTCPPPIGNAMASTVLALTMVKHKTVNDLTPPPPVIVLGGLCFVCTVFGAVSKASWPKYVFLLYNLITATVFLLDTKTPITDTWPSIESDPLALKVGILYGEVTGCLSLMCALTTCPPPLGNFMAGCVIAATMGKHHFVDGVTPPVPVIVLNAISVLSCLAGVMSSTTRPTGKKEA